MGSQEKVKAGAGGNPGIKAQCRGLSPASPRPRSQAGDAGEGTSLRAQLACCGPEVNLGQKDQGCEVPAQRLGEMGRGQRANREATVPAAPRLA